MASMILLSVLIYISERRSILEIDACLTCSAFASDSWVMSMAVRSSARPISEIIFAAETRFGRHLFLKFFEVFGHGHFFSRSFFSAVERFIQTKVESGLSGKTV